MADTLRSVQPVHPAARKPALADTGTQATGRTRLGGRGGTSLDREEKVTRISKIMPLKKRERKRRIFALLIFPVTFGLVTIAVLLRVAFVGVPTAEDLSSLMPRAEVNIKRGGLRLVSSHNMTGSAGLLLEAAQAAASAPVFDEDVNVTVEKERCGRYHLPYTGRSERRRIFYGSLIADDSWHAVLFTALEGYGIYHSAAFVESNRT